ncbi:Ribosome-inactivating protein [Beauveria brongniartii RCEF 3172]|uniref:Ribosome-inactivating protein n=1 Tax=Beauveria brongniartii RCEF 3172 TaxID=1081107 RepID=A0A166Z6C4_9HYPO|nr:Ribosome-inactivating protein [Beauveria brongniartii RCEF 3172]
MSIKIRAEEPGDVDMIRLLNDQAFEKMQHSNGNESAIVDSLRERGALTLSLVATVDNEVVGHVAYSLVTIDDKDEGWFGLGPVAVRPSKQGSGIGSALIRAGLHDLRTANARGTAGPRLYRPPGRLHLLAAAIAILALALQLSLPGPRLMEMKTRQDQCGATPQGRTLLEVYFVRIDNIDNEDPGDLYGSITTTDALGTDTLWKQDPSFKIKPGQDVPLTGPSRPISGSGAFSIDLDLCDYDSWPDPSFDDQVALGSVQWNPEDPSNQYDTTHYQQITGNSGSTSVRYAVLQRAVTAQVSAVLAKGDENPDDVCGTITAGTGLDKIVLFDVACESGKTVSVNEGNPVPLRRSVLAVSLDDSLTIEAHLWDRDQVSSNDEIANGSEAFAAKADTKKTISGASGRVDVNVEWVEL